MPSTSSVCPPRHRILRGEHLRARQRYIAKREADIGDHVKAGQLLAEIVAPELDHQISQAEATLGQLQAALQQAQANRELAKVTWDRDGPLVKQGWLTRSRARSTCRP